MQNNESFGFGPYIGKCSDTGAYQIVGACSDQLSPNQIKKARKGERFIGKTKAKFAKIPKESFSTYFNKKSLNEASKSKDDSKKIDSNLQKAIMDIAGNLEKSFKKFTKNTREKAWKRITSADGEKEIKKILQDPERQLSIFAKLGFKEWLDINS